MNTVFNLLKDPAVRKHPAALLGSNDLGRLDLFISTYAMACEAAGNTAPLLTPGGVSVNLFREYIARKENMESTGGIGHILLTGAGGDTKKAWEKFFAYVDSFAALQITARQKMRITEEHRKYQKEHYPVYTYENGELQPREFLPAEMFFKISLSDGLCWIEDRNRALLQSIASEADTNRHMLQMFGDVCWEPIEE